MGNEEELKSYNRGLVKCLLLCQLAAAGSVYGWPIEGRDTISYYGVSCEMRMNRIGKLIEKVLGDQTKYTEIIQEIMGGE